MTSQIFRICANQACSHDPNARQDPDRTLWSGLGAFIVAFSLIAAASLDGATLSGEECIFAFGAYAADHSDASTTAESEFPLAPCSTDSVASVLRRTFFAADVPNGIPGGASAAGLNVADDHGDKLSTSTDISIGTPVKGQIGTTEDADYFRLILGEPSLVSIYTIGDLDTVGTLIDSDGREVAANDDSGKMANFRIEANLDPGIHYLRMRTSANATGSYELHAKARATSPARFTNSIGMEFVLVPAGEFDMGSTSEEAFSDEQPVTRVRISSGFYLGKHEVTHEEWEAVMGSNPSHFANCGPDCPVEQVSWNDVQVFIQRLNEREGSSKYRLPTEAEWEYAARAGTKGDRYDSDLGTIAWYEGNSGGTPHPVGQKRANAFGLHDTLGNVEEWVHDWHGEYPGGTVTDPTDPSTGSGRVTRGGGWRSAMNDDGVYRASARIVGDPDRHDYYALGFRLAMTLNSQAVIDLSDATPLAIGSSATGRVGPGDEVDYFSLEVNEPTVVAIYTTGSLDTLGSLRDSSNSKLAGDDDSGEGTNFRIEATLNVGIHYVRVESYHNVDGTYTLHVERQAAATPPPTARELTNSFDMEFALVGPGEFQMGSNSGDDDEAPVTQVRITRPFYMGKHEVTQGQWEKVMENNPSSIDCGSDCPVETISWVDALEFVKRLNEKEDTTLYRLPTEAEWEYAARAGTTEDRYWPNLDEIAWHEGNSGDTTHPVGEKRANAFGLYDTLGNVWEFVWDWGGSYAGGTVTDPSGPRTGSKRVGRGGAFSFPAQRIRASERGYATPSEKSRSIGLRVAISGEPQPVFGARIPDDDHSDVREGATALTVGVPVRGRIQRGYDVDVFRLDLDDFSATQDTDVAIYTTGSLGTMLTLLDSEGTLIGGGATNFRIETALRKGEYYVIVKSDGNSTGHYELHVKRRTVFMSAATGMEFELVPAGEFEMGSRNNVVDSRTDERPVRRVQVSQPFYMGKYEVTQEQWEAVMGKDRNLSANNDCPQCPVEGVTWDDALEFVMKLNEIEGDTLYRLPTEAEWEYAARGSTKPLLEQRYAPLDQIAWYDANSNETTHRVGQKRANGFGLHDMLGNVWEWVEDWYGIYEVIQGPIIGGPALHPDPTSPAKGSKRVRRGCSWTNVALYCRAAQRQALLPDFRFYDLGLRLARTAAGIPGSGQPGTADPGPTAIDLGSINRTIKDRSESDVFRLELDKETDLAIYTTGSLTTWGTLWNDAGTQANHIRISEKGSGGTGNFVIHATLDPGVYFVRVRILANPAGAYTLHALPQNPAFTTTELGADLTMKFMKVPAGTFNMGSMSDEAGGHERPVTPVTISQPFYMGKYEVTQGQWEAVMRDGREIKCGECPIEDVSWDDVQEFISKLNKEIDDHRTYRLPTEAEWEYAARAGTKNDRYAEDLSLFAWYRGNSDGTAHPVGKRLANSLGLHDMLGNVSEWVQDWAGGRYPGVPPTGRNDLQDTVSDPIGPQMGEMGQARVVRGCSWRDHYQTCRLAHRGSRTPNAGFRVGFRLAMSPDGGTRSTNHYILDDHGGVSIDATNLLVPYSGSFELNGEITSLGDNFGPDRDYFHFKVHHYWTGMFSTEGSLNTKVTLRARLVERGRPAIRPITPDGLGKYSSPLSPGSYYLVVEPKDPSSNDTGVYKLVAEINRYITATEPKGKIDLDSSPLPAHPTGGKWVGSTILEMGQQTISSEEDNYFELPKVPERTRVAVYMSLENNDFSATLQVEGEAVRDSHMSNDENFPVVIDLEPGDDAHQYIRIKASGSYALVVEEIRPLREEDYFEETANGIMGMKFVKIPSTDDLRERFRIRDLIKDIEEPEKYVFYMGQDDKEFGWLKEHSHETRSERNITTFWIGQYEVTQCEWSFLMNHPDDEIRKFLDGEDVVNSTDPQIRKFLGEEDPDTTDRFKWFCREHRNGQKPIVNITYLDTLAFIVALNERMEGEAYYRLPSEAEWEYAAQAGTPGERYGQIDDIAWYSGNSGKLDEESKSGEAQPELKVGGWRRPNAFGLYDMLGNVWEWTHDVYDRDFTAIRWALGGLNFVGDKASDVAGICDPFIGAFSLGDLGPVGTSVAVTGLVYDVGRNLHAQTPDRVLRGGSFREPEGNIRAAIRLRGEPGLQPDLQQRLDEAIAELEKKLIGQTVKDVSERKTLWYRKIKINKSLKNVVPITKTDALGWIDKASASFSDKLPWAKKPTKGDDKGFRLVRVPRKNTSDLFDHTSDLFDLFCL